MISPKKFSNIDLWVLALSYYILDILKSNHNIKYTLLLKTIVSEKGEDSKINLPFSLAFLYSLWVLEYRKKQDLLIYLK